MNDSQSDRKVLPFPAELRLQIYRNLVKKTYLALRTIPTEKYCKPIKASTGLVILRVSKATSAEALQLLYKESVFLFNFHKSGIPLGVSRYPPPPRIVALMNNVSFEIPAFYLHTRNGTIDFSALCDTSNPQSLMEEINRTVQPFAGTACFRNVLRVKSKRCGKDDTFDCEAMKILGGFRKVVIEFESLPCMKLAKPMPEWFRAGETWSQSQRDQFNSEFDQSKSQCEKLRKSALQYLEPTYGPAVQGTVHDTFNYTCYLEFYPRQHLAKESLIQAGKILKEAARLATGKRSVAALSEMVETLKLL